MTTRQQYIRENVFCRCEHLVKRLQSSNLVPGMALPFHEYEISEWWLVSRDLAARLDADNLQILRFTELCIWGRLAVGVPLEEDIDLITAIGHLPPATRGIN